MGRRKSGRKPSGSDRRRAHGAAHFPMPLETLNLIRLDPELMEAALDRVAEEHGTGLVSVTDVMVSAVTSFTAFYGYDDDNPVPIERTDEMVALTRRVMAVMHVLRQLNLANDDASFAAICEAACTARMIRGEDAPAMFQPLEFLTAYQRART